MKKAGIIIGCIVGALLLLAVIVVNSITLTKIEDRAGEYRKKVTDSVVIWEETAGMDDEQILRYAVKRTAQDLTFSIDTNCMHYASYCASVFNCACQHNGLPSSVEAKPVVGYVHIWGINVCKVLYGLTGCHFIKDHDVTEVHLADGRAVLVDANAYDYLFSDLSSPLITEPR